MSEQSFNELIQRYLDGKASEKEKAKIERWLEHRSANKLFDQLPDEKKQHIKARMLVNIEERIIPQKRIYRPLFKAVWYRTAAAVLLLGMLTFFAWQYRDIFRAAPVELLKESTSGQINKVLLADGSIVWLKGNSSLLYPDWFKGEERLVNLQGEALFEVAENPEKPFKIQCGDMTATVLGTSFNIKTTEEKIEVAVLTGKVSLSSADDPQGIVVLPSETGMYSRTSKLLAKVTQPIEQERVAAVVAGTEYNMHFEDSRMAEVIGRIERKFEIQVELEHADLGDRIITADLTDQSLENTLDIIAKVLDVNYKIRKDRVIIRGERYE